MAHEQTPGTGEKPQATGEVCGTVSGLKGWGNHTYLVERQGQSSIQSEARLKPYHACPEKLGQAPATLKPRRGPSIKGARLSRLKKKSGGNPRQPLTSNAAF